MFKYVRTHFFGNSTTHVGNPGEITSDDSGSLFLHDGATPGGNILPRTLHYDLSTAQLLSCHTNPIEIVPAPGTGKAVIPICAVLSTYAGSVSYTGGTNAGLYYSLGDYPITNDAAMTIANGRNSITVSYPNPNDAASWKIDNSPIVFTASANFMNGNGQATIVMTYVIVSLSNDGEGDV